MITHNTKVFIVLDSIVFYLKKYLMCKVNNKSKKNSIFYKTDKKKYVLASYIYKNQL